MPLDPDDPDLERIIEIANAELGRLEVTTARRLREMYERERDALLHRISEMESDDTFGVRHAQVITKALTAAIRRLGEDLAATQHKAIGQAIELGADAGAREVGQLEARFGSPAASRAIASLAGVIPHRAIAATEKLKVFKAVTELANGETRTTLIELDRMTRAAIARGLIQGQSSRQMVPELRKLIGKQVDSKAWELERTLRTGTNAAVNMGHHEAYREAKELLPDLKRQGNEHLGLAAKTGGRRENHPFSKHLHGAVAELDKPWVIPSGKLPVMFWPHDDARGAYVGRRYPAHLWERGREVPYREAWERRKKSFESAGPPGKYLAYDPPQTWTQKRRAHIENIVNEMELGAFGTRHPLKPIAFEHEIWEEQQRRTGTYLNGQVTVGLARTPAEIGRPLIPGRTQKVSAAGKDLDDVWRRSIAHEIGHHVWVKAVYPDKKLLSTLGRLSDRTTGKAATFTRASEADPREYFAELLSAYQFHPDELRTKNLLGYRFIRGLRQRLGMGDLEARG